MMQGCISVNWDHPPHDLCSCPPPVSSLLDVVDEVGDTRTASPLKRLTGDGGPEMRFCAGDTVSSICPTIEGNETEHVGAVEGTEIEGMRTVSLSVTPFCLGGGDPLSSLSPAADGKEAEGMDTKAKEAEETTSSASLSVRLLFTLVFSSRIFCVGGGDPISSLSPTAGGKEAESMDTEAKEAVDQSSGSLSLGTSASLSTRPRLVVETFSLVVVLPLPPPPATAGGGDPLAPATAGGDPLAPATAGGDPLAPATAGGDPLAPATAGGDPVSPLAPATERADRLPSTLPPLFLLLPSDGTCVYHNDHNICNVI